MAKAAQELSRAIINYIIMVRGGTAWPNGVGAMKVGKRYVKFGTPGIPDVCALSANE